LIGKELKRQLAADVCKQLRLSSSTEVLPDQNNRVTLSTQLDALGLPKPQLAFQEGEYTRAGLLHSVDVFKGIFAAAGCSNVVLDDKPNTYSGAGHILGTCRMGDDPAQSVVDRNCRAHDHPNLFIVGSSVFPTCGTANPTLTLAALALRAVDAIVDAVQIGSATTVNQT
jgi:choline dehydrogenase-like flavoprotein